MKVRGREICVEASRAVERGLTKPLGILESESEDGGPRVSGSQKRVC